MPLKFAQIVQANGEATDPLGNGDSGSGWDQWFKDREHLEQIRLDVLRTHQNVPFFASGTAHSKLHQEVCKPICTCLLTPAVHLYQCVYGCLKPCAFAVHFARAQSPL